MKKYKGLVIGLVLGVLLSATSTAFAGNIMETIHVLLNKVNIAINDELVGRQGEHYTLDNGEEVPMSISYKNTTYLPIRKVAEILGSQVKWEQATKTIHIIGKEITQIEDKVKPEVTAVSNMGNHRIEITFSEEVDQETAEDIANYKLAKKEIEHLMVKYKDDTKLVITKAILDASKKKVVLMTEEERQWFFAIEVNGIKDVSGNVMDTYSDGFVTSAAVDSDMLDIEMVSNTIITFTFHVPVNEETVTNKANYVITSNFSKDNKLAIKDIVYDAELKKVTITTDEIKLFVIYQLELFNIKDIHGEPVYPTQGRFGELPQL
ncbi:hypothetical protein HZI73_03490 [Vallitalea pronyensis]|uniref:Copper amine oxidase-like N-terminal domain-containing protein n=1 Tax=Vallitalea pronyensis TaxID=1348613 RepID=A0A8J8SFJ7_9FIRM|nr:stalk domain-containing protein [Vallitalea pronyensis]QUI21404.1 hypothetical protein HZI73_03490 [Vallitalea pronyensis]